MKNPNGYGCIRKLSGKRRKPWAIIRTTGWTENGKQERTYLGYYRTRQEAVKALADYNDYPYDLNGYTFAEMYAKWSEYKFPTISASNVRGYEAAFKKCEKIHDRRMNDLVYQDLQSIIDPETPSTGSKIRVLMRQMYEYAEKRSLVSRNLTHLLETKQSERSKLHNRFTNDEITALWERSDDEYVRVILMMIYSGVRPGELLALETKDVHLDKRYFSIRAGKNRNAIRDVPIYYRTLPFFESWIAKGKKHLITTTDGKMFNFARAYNTYALTYFANVLDRYGLLYNGNERHHPDDVRHTFTTMWHEKKLSEVYRRKIQGHSGAGVGENVYTHISLDELIAEIDKL